MVIGRMIVAMLALFPVAVLEGQVELVSHRQVCDRQREPRHHKGTFLVDDSGKLAIREKVLASRPFIEALFWDF